MVIRRVIWIDHFFADTPEHRLADKQFVGVALGMHLKMFAVAEIDTRD